MLYWFDWQVGVGYFVELGRLGVSCDYQGLGCDGFLISQNFFDCVNGYFYMQYFGVFEYVDI